MEWFYIAEIVEKYYDKEGKKAKRGKKMSILTFKGGVHPYDGKELSKDMAVRKINPGKEVVIPLSQHIGAPAVPVVDIGERVLKGQLIAEAGGFISANIHSSVSGTVKTVSYTHLRAHET